MASQGSSIRARQLPIDGPSADEATHLSRPGGDDNPALDWPVSASSTAPAVEAAPDDKTVISNRPPLADPLPLAARPPHLGQTLIGKRLEHYHLDEFVGGGGMGAVFRATDTRLGRTVAVKVLSRDHTDEETIRRFQNEAQSAARLDHPNIARVHYVGEDSGWSFIVFEFIEGTNLRDLVEQRGPLPLEEALQYTLQVAEALAHSSSRDVIHRDIKPSNVLVMAGGQVKLVDMGLARLHQVESSAEDLTASGVTLGTFDYISPEQARDPRSADVRSDIYSLGCTLYFMLTGRPPFPDGTALQKLLRHNADEPPDVRIFRPELHPRIATLLTRMLAKRPSQRHQTAVELIADILAAGQQLGLSSIAQHGHVVVTSGSAADFWQRAWQVVAAAALLIVGIVLLDAYLPSRGDSGDVSLRPSPPLPPEAPSAPDAATPTSANDGSANQSNGASGAQSPIPPTVAPAQRSGNGDGPAPLAPSPAIANSAATTSDDPGDDLPNLDPGQLSGGVVVPPLEATIGPQPLESIVAVAPQTNRLSAEEVSPQPRRVVLVGASPTPPEPEVFHAATLAEACRRAAELGLNEIELRCGRLVERPLEIPNSRLTLRAADGFQPIIVFQPTTGIGGKEMIRLAGGNSARLSVHGVELRMELPAGPPATGWALLAMSSGQRLELDQSVLTVQDGDVTRGPVHDQVAMIVVHSRKAADTMTMMDPQPMAMASSAAISLEDTIARGAATFISMPVETVLSVSWNNGLLVTPSRLIETGGSPTDPRGYGISVRLENVTAVAGQGLYQMKLQPGSVYTMVTTVTTRHCILMAEPGTPLFDYVGVSSVGPEDLRSEGSDNSYPTDVYFLRVHSGAAGETAALHYLNKHLSSNEMSSKPGDPWIVPPPLDRPPHELTKYDFLPDELADGAGFDPIRLPEASTLPYQPAPPADGLVPPAPAEEEVEAVE